MRPSLGQELGIPGIAGRDNVFLNLQGTSKIGQSLPWSVPLTMRKSVAFGQKPRKPIEHQRKSLTSFLEVLLVAKANPKQACDNDQRAPRKIGQSPPAAHRLTMRKSVVERVCVGQQAVSGEGDGNFPRCPKAEKPVSPRQTEPPLTAYDALALHRTSAHVFPICFRFTLWYNCRCTCFYLEPVSIEGSL